MEFIDRHHAGTRLATALQGKSFDGILALPRGGVPVATPVCLQLSMPLDLLLVKKLGVPGNSEYAFGALTSHGAPYLNQEIIDSLGLAESTIQGLIEKKRQEIEALRTLYGAHSTPCDIDSQHLLIIDDGIATGATAKAAILSLKAQAPASITLATPIIAEDSYLQLKPMVDELIALDVPSLFYAVGQFYQDFNQVSDNDVIQCLNQVNPHAP